MLLFIRIVHIRYQKWYSMVINRSSGILLHITSLPGKYGIGTLGQEAYDFVDFLSESGQTYWQILPIGPVNPVLGFSPYASTSTFAGNYLFISIEELSKEPWFIGELHELITDKNNDDHFVYYDEVIDIVLPILKKACEDFFNFDNAKALLKYEIFCKENSFWLDDFARFTVFAEHFETDCWLKWDKEIALRNKRALDELTQKLKDEIKFQKFLQYIFFRQWDKLKDYCLMKNISIIGDIPIYISMDGAEAWSNPEILQLDKKTLEPEAVSGVPPDYFSETGQRWGNPLYQWFNENNTLKEETMQWWIQRISHLNKYVDIIRIDHFRGFESYWSIPADEETAIKGTWVPGPGKQFFNTLLERLGDLPLIAEDLGIITPEVETLRDDLQLPGMKILQFAFDFNNDNYYLPHNIDNKNCILYTGTHDNNTTNGWYYGEEIDETRREYIKDYMDVDSDSDFHWKLIKQAYRTVANLVITPVQDILGYGQEFRMNKPGTTKGNWGWKLTSSCITQSTAQKLHHIGKLYKRLA